MSEARAVVVAVMDEVERTFAGYIKGAEPSVSIMLAMLRADILVDVENVILPAAQAA